MYEDFYGLRERPFDLTPNPRYLFMTGAHREALSTIQYGISGRKGVTLLLGPAGTGKTTLVHAALERQQGQNIKTLYLTNPTLTRDEFLQFLSAGFGLSRAAGRSKTQLLQELEQFLIALRPSGGGAALIVDEAQALAPALLEEIRLLANLETPTEKLLPIVLVGQAEFTEVLRQPALQPLKQRVALRATLAPLTFDETATYIAERIRIAGGEIANVFSNDAVAAVYEFSRGIPRTISVVCDNSLVSGFALDERPIGRPIVLEVSRDFDLVAAANDRAISTRPAVRPTEAPRPLRPAVPVSQASASVERPAAVDKPGSLDKKENVGRGRPMFSMFIRTADR